MSDGMSLVAQNAVGVTPARLVGAIIAGFDVHLRQITFDCLDSATGEVTRGQIGSSPLAVREWAEQFPGREVHAAMEACTGWLFVARALEDVGAVAHLAETVKTRALRGRKRRAEDRPPGRPVAAGAARRGPAARGVDRSRAHPPVALAPASAQSADRRAHPVAAQDPFGAVSPGISGRAGSGCRG